MLTESQRSETRVKRFRATARMLSQPNCHSDSPFGMGHPYPRKLEPIVVWVQKRFIVSECMPSMELGGQTGGGVVLLTFNLNSLPTLPRGNTINGDQGVTTRRNDDSPGRDCVDLEGSVVTRQACHRRPENCPTRWVQWIADGLSIVLFGIPRR